MKLTKKNELIEQIEEFSDNDFLINLIKEQYFKIASVKTLQTTLDILQLSLNEIREEPERIFTLESFKNIIENKITKHNLPLTKNSIKSYIIGFRHLSNAISDTPDEIDVNLLQNPEYVFNRINKYFKNGRQKWLSWSIIGNIDPILYNTTEYKKFGEILYNEQQSIKVPLIKEYHEIIQQLRNDKFSNYKFMKIKTEQEKIDYLVKKLMSSIGFRVQIMRSLMYRNYDDNKDNFYKDGRIYIRNSKTKNIFDYDVNSEEKTCIDLLIRLAIKNNSDYLVYNKKGEMYKDGAFNSYLKKIFGFAPGIMIRHSISHDVNFKEQFELKKFNSLRMDNSVQTQTNHYNTPMISLRDV